MSQETMLSPLNTSDLHSAFGQFASGVTIVTTQGTDGNPYGAMVTAFVAVSLDPPLAQITLTRSSRAAKHLDGSAFAINILSADQLGIAKHFAGDAGEDEPQWLFNGKVPVLVGNAATLECRAWNNYDGGDHIIVVGEVCSLTVGQADPLLFHEGAFHRMGEPLEIRRDGSWFAGAKTFQPLIP
ncbi:flavin reductase family protein [Paeniglutamicibacter terrestris]|uniref:Flavin reductase family protein n=1 Tax=Paeniglutamicibacter terrestris TaxID=2723403 RepID=A0ABX1G0T6_9MICC|nr:flavin reductase family protein [Paeniglutamicibacter terrestris]ASN38145.1 flavin reductase [Arthrobacter sp. 7749]NKG19654.1 flavin reductase family protein [Paeniglutamicibacter terrestris]